MCGIVGVITRNDTPSSKLLQAQLDTLTHRGPDARGVFTKEMAGIGQTRLAVMDPSLGNPPLTNSDATIAAVLNGEIYNYRAIKKTSLSRVKFRSDCDTEVLAHLAEQGSTAASLAMKLEGMFAFAIWNTRVNQLQLGRDRVGKKPLYYTTASNGDFVFSSEIKALLLHPDVGQEISREAIHDYLAYGYVPTPHTIFRGIFSLPPGHVLTYSPGAEPQIDCYWELPKRQPGGKTMSFEKAKGELQTKLNNAVQQRLVSDVPLGVFLSGGVDSSAIAAIATRTLGNAVDTFTIGFDDNDGFDERDYARAVAKHIGSRHWEEVVSPNAVDLVEQLVWHHDQPFGDASAIPTFCLAQMTKQHATVALSGDGGDELFAGYERFLGGMLVEAYGRIPSALRRIATAPVNALPRLGRNTRLETVRRFITAADKGMPTAFVEWISYVQQNERAALLQHAPRLPPHSNGLMESLWAETSGMHTLDRLLDLNFRTYLLDDLLPKVDRMSMAHGLEVRSPFLDQDLIDFAVQLHPTMKISRFNLKRILKATVADLLPPEILERKKRGFGVPLDRWFRENLRSYSASTLGHPDAELRHYLDSQSIDSLLQDHWSGRKNLGLTLWTLLTLEVFLQKIK